MNVKAFEVIQSHLYRHIGYFGYKSLTHISPWTKYMQQAHQHNESNEACMTFACDTKSMLGWLNAEINSAAHGRVVTLQLHVSIFIREQTTNPIFNWFNIHQSMQSHLHPLQKLKPSMHGGAR